MAEAHIAALLPTQNRVVSADENTAFLAHYDLNEHDVLRNVKALGETNALSFNGAGSYIDLGNFGQSSLTNCTIEFWSKTSSTALWLFMMGQDTSYYLIADNNGTSNLYHSKAGTPTVYMDGTAITRIARDGQWHHYAIVGANLSSWTKAVISNYPSWQINGSLSNIRVWNRPLSVEEIKTNASNQVKTDASGLVAYWKLNEGTGTIARDISPFHNDRLITGTTWTTGNSVFTLRNKEGYFGGGAIAVEEATTNLSTSLYVNGMNGITYTYVGDENGYKKYSISGTWNAGAYPYSFSVSGITFTGGVSYSVSCYAYTNASNKFASFGTINMVNDANMTGTQIAVRSGNYTARQDFIYSTTQSQPCYFVSMPTANGTVFDPTTDFLYIKDFQIEQKPFATSFVNGSRTTGRLEYPVNINGDFTISLYYKSVAPSGYASDRTILALTNGTNAFNFFNGYGTDWYMGDEVGRTRFRLADRNVPTDFEHLVIVRQGTVISLYRNGVLTDSKDFGSKPSFTSMSLGGGYILESQRPNGIFDEVRVDNVARTEAEIQAWYYSNSPFWPRGIYRKPY